MNETYNPAWDIYRVRDPKIDREIGVCIPPKEVYLSLHKKFTEHADQDQTVFELRKFLMLAKDCNPVALEVLYADKDNILHMSSIGEELRENREIFLSKKAMGTFENIAKRQIRHLRDQLAWTHGKPEHPGVYTLPIRKNRIFHIDSFCQFDPDNFPTHDEKEVVKTQFGEKESFNWFHGKTYFLKLYDFNKYKALTKPGELTYDTKLAYDCIRYLSMATTLLKTGKVDLNFEAFDDLEKGEWDHDRIFYESDLLLKQLDTLGEWSVENSPLPPKPNVEKIDKLCVSLIERKWS